MTAKDIIRKGKRIVSGYKYALLAALCGVILMLIPFGEKKKQEEIPRTDTYDIHAVERELEEILSSSAGVGRVKVMLTLERSEETVYMTEGSRQASEGGTDEKSEVSKVNGDEGETALVRKTLSPVFRGALVLCEGADDDGVRYRVTEAVSALLGLGSDKISVVVIN